MAQEHDLFDDIIEISKGFDFLKNPLGGVTDALDPSAPQWNPADYKERPRGNTIPCLTCKNAVSYTHLDVYKRQVSRCRKRSIFGGERCIFWRGTVLPGICSQP